MVVRFSLFLSVRAEISRVHKHVWFGSSVQMFYGTVQKLWKEAPILFIFNILIYPYQLIINVQLPHFPRHFAINTRFGCCWTLYFSSHESLTTLISKVWSPAWRFHYSTAEHNFHQPAACCIIPYQITQNIWDCYGIFFNSKRLDIFIALRLKYVRLCQDIDCVTQNSKPNDVVFFFFEERRHYVQAATVHRELRTPVNPPRTGEVAEVSGGPLSSGVGPSSGSDCARGPRGTRALSLHRDSACAPPG